MGSASAGFEHSGDVDFLGRNPISNVLETKAVQLALKAFLTLIIGEVLVLTIDNAAVVAYT